jgi:serine/threonine protein kinase
VKIPKNAQDANDLHTEYCVFNELGKHENIIRMLEYCEREPCYMAMQFAKAKCLFNYLSSLGDQSTKNEKWARFFFKQIV